MNKITYLLLAGIILWALPAGATIKEMVKYKTGNTGVTGVSCKTCHLSDATNKPSKDNLNAYAQAALKAAQGKDTTSDTYKTLGLAEKFVAPTATK